MHTVNTMTTHHGVRTGYRVDSAGTSGKGYGEGAASPSASSPEGLLRFAPALRVTHSPCLYPWGGGATFVALFFHEYGSVLCRQQQRRHAAIPFSNRPELFVGPRPIGGEEPAPDLQRPLVLATILRAPRWSMPASERTITDDWGVRGPVAVPPQAWCGRCTVSPLVIGL